MDTDTYIFICESTNYMETDTQIRIYESAHSFVGPCTYFFLHIDAYRCTYLSVLDLRY